MEKLIQIYDNLLLEEDENIIEQKIYTETPFQFSSSAVDNNGKYIPAFFYSFFDETGQKQPWSVDAPYVFSILNRFCSTANLELDRVIRIRTHIQLPLLNPSPHYPHIDDECGHWVILYYVNDSDGDTIFFDDNKNEIKRITPKKGRIVFFDGSIWHSSSSPQTIHRAVINFNFTGKKL